MRELQRALRCLPAPCNPTDGPKYPRYLRAPGRYLPWATEGLSARDDGPKMVLVVLRHVHTRAVGSLLLPPERGDNGSGGPA
jgi:hypothetical protein